MLAIGSFHLPSILLSLFSWGSLYFTLRRLQPQRKAEWHCRTVTAVHASLISLITAWSTFVQGPWPFTDAGGPNTPLQVTATTICLGYFLFDFAWCLYFQTEGLTMLLHHSLSIVGLCWTLLVGKYGTEMVATICGSEVTNPLLQLRWFLKETGRYHTLLGEVVDVAFMLSFFTIRIGIGSLLLYCYFQQPTDFWGRLGATCIYLISWIFWISIFQYAIYKYTKKYRAWCRAKKDRSLQLPNGSACDGGDGERSQGHSDVKVKSVGSCESPRGCLASEGPSHSSDLSKNGLHHRSNGMHVPCDGTSATGDSVTGKGRITNGVLPNDKKIL